MPDKEPPSFPQTGGCQCGAIRYELREPPFGVWACPCSVCRKQSGSAFGMSMGVMIDHLVFTQGEPAMWTRKTEAGHLSDSFFCRDCGTRLVHRRQEHGGRQVVKPGSLDDMSWVAPDRHIFTDTALAWVRPLIPSEQE